MPGVISRVVSLLGVVATVLGMLLGQSSSVAACSCEAQTFGDADVVAVGTVSSWRTRPDLEQMAGSFTPVELRLDVDIAFKGDPPKQLRFVEWASYFPGSKGEEIWAGDSGACGTFNFDPTGVRAIYALYDHQDTLVAGLCSNTIIPPPGSDASTILNEALVQAETELGPPREPLASEGASTNWAAVALVAAAGAAVLATGTLLANRRGS